MATITNQASLTYRGLTRLSNRTVGQLDNGLTVDKNVNTETYTPGERKVYSVALRNTGTGPLTDLTFSDDLGGYVYQGQTVYPLTFVAGSVQYYVNGVLQADPAVVTAEPLVFQGIDLPAGGSAVLIYEAEVSDYADPGQGGTITNTVTVEGAPGGNSQASVTITALAQPVLDLVKAMSPTTVTACETVTYTLTLCNSGNAATEAGDNVVVSDTFEPVLHNITVTLDGVALAAGTDYTYDESTGAFATVAGAIALDAATFTQHPDGTYETVPAVAELAISGTMSADCGGTIQF